MTGQKTTGAMHPDRAALCIAVAGLVIALGAWETLARTRAATDSGLVRAGRVLTDASRSDSISRTLAEIESPSSPRVLILGSSQIARVKSESGWQLATPARLDLALRDAGVEAEIVDLSAGGQQVVESLAIGVASFDAVKARVVVLGLGIINMQSTTLRPTLASELDLGALEIAIRAQLPNDLDPGLARGVLGFAGQRAPEESHPTLQARLDGRIADWLGRASHAIRDRRSLYREWIDRPIRRDLAQGLSRRLSNVETARTHPAGSAFAPSLVALEVMADHCRERGVELLVFVHPFDDTRPPSPYLARDHEGLLESLYSLERSGHLHVLDLSRELGPERFRAYADESPDNFHYDAAGHDAVGRALATLLAPLLTRPSTGAAPR